MSSEERKKHVLAVRSLKPSTSLENQNKVAENHPIEPGKENPSQRFLLTDWKIEEKSQKKSQVDDLYTKETVSYELFFRSLVSRLVEQCQGNCGVKLKTSDDGDYLLIKSHAPSTYTVKRETRTKNVPQYVHFNSKCLLEYAHAKHDIKYNKFPFPNIKVDRLTYDLTYDRLTYKQKRRKPP